MKSQILTLGITGAMMFLGSGCKVLCEFQKIKHVPNQKPYLVDCRGLIVTCDPGSRECRSKLKMECEGIPVYYGPYKINIKNDTIKYVASDWHGPDAPYIISKIPQHDHEIVEARESDDDSIGSGYCKYDFRAD